MLNYTSQNQIEIFNFKTEFESKLNPENRWVKLAKLLDWDAFAAIYGTNFSTTMGAKGIDARVVIGALIIKHVERKDDRGTIEMIAENPYMQYFLGFDHFSSVPVFDPSLFVHIRKRLGNENFDKMNEIIIAKALNINDKNNLISSDSKDDSFENDDNNSSETNDKTPNRGKLQLDATIADANIKFPTDLSLLNDAREKSEKIIDIFCAELQIEKPRTYRIQARKQWLNLSKKKNKNYKEIRKGVGQQLNYLKRNLKHIDNIIDNNPLILCVLDKNMYNYLLVITELERQQRQMFKDKVKSISNRIVSIHQPHVRAMVRGKQGKNVEFGAKINVSLQHGYARIDQVDFEAFNEGKYLIDQIERFKKLNKHYPELVQTDDIYMNRENRKYLKDNNIRHTGRALGRKPKIELTTQQKKIQRFEKNERNHIEGKFGQAKSKYGLNNIKAKLENTSKSWIAAVIFVINILKLSKDILCQFLNDLICVIFLITNQNRNVQTIKIKLD